MTSAGGRVGGRRPRPGGATRLVVVAGELGAVQVGVTPAGGQQQAGDGQPLTLAPRQAVAPLADHRVEPVGQGGDEVGEALAGRTAVVIAHRLSTVRAADRILVVEDGRIIESGQHAELIAAGGRYAELYRTQFEERAAEQPVG